MKASKVPTLIAMSVGLVWASVLALNAPGHLSYDSIVQLAEGRSQSYQSMHPPLMSALLGLGDWLMPGTGLYLVLSSGIFFFSLLLLSMRARRPLVPAIAILILGISPFVLVYQGIIWKDVLFANLSILAFTLLYEASQHTKDDKKQKVRFLLYFFSIMVSGVSALVRQNGILVPLFIAVAIACLEIQRTSKTAWWNFRVGAAITFFAIAISAMSAWSISTLIRATAATPSGDSTQLGLRSLFTYDIVAISSLAGEKAYAPLAARGINAEKFVLNAKKVYTPERIDYISISGILDDDLAILTQAGVSDVWLDLVTQNPREYVDHRTAVLGELLWPTRPERCLPVHVGISGPDTLMNELQLTPGQRITDQALYTYSQNFFDTALMLPVLYFFSALGIIAFLMARPRQGSIPIVSMLTAAVCFSLSYLAIGIACDLRYVYFLIVAVFAALIYVIASGLRGINGSTSTLGASENC